jgi:hypothetical protein
MNTQSNVLGMKVSGNIISELSDRIPNNFMALNELIKNAYDADATMVEINLLTSEKKITVQDDGCGMDRLGIENLLHIARSNKNYAVMRSNGRITQGEKGLGALATFHFGNSVTWETSQDEITEFKFNVQKNEILEQDDISEYQTTIIESDASFKGTKITIDDISNEEFEFIVSTLENKKTVSKLVRSLFDSDGINNFSVTISVDGISCVNNEDLTVPEYNNQERIYRVEYASTDETGEIKFFYKDTLVFKEPFSMDSTLNDFNVKCKLNIYDLGGKVSNANFPALYHKEQEKPDITPLVYINQGFFKNYVLFDVDVARRLRSADALAQMTGEIEIRTQSDKLMFNADRTEINENIITAKLKSEIERLNKTIQKIGAKYKAPFIETNRGRLPASIIAQKSLDITDKNEEQIKLLVSKNILNKVFAELTSSKIFDDKAIYTFLDKEIEAKLFIKEPPKEETPKYEPPHNPQDEDNQPPSQSGEHGDAADPANPAIITLKDFRIVKTIGRTGQVNLFDFIVQKNTKDSSGNEIPLNEIAISDNKGLMRTANILPAVNTPQEVIITYTYNDSKTGSESKSLTLVFVEPQKLPMESAIASTDIIHTHGIGGFVVSFDPVAGKLVEQINSLETDDYSEMIACSLRTLFELGVDAIKNKTSSSTTFCGMKASISQSKINLEEKVKTIVSFAADKNNCRNIERHLTNLPCTNVSYNTLKNIANVERISSNARESNLGAHKGTTNLSLQQIVDISNSASAFLIFVEGIVGAADNF